MVLQAERLLEVRQLVGAGGLAVDEFRAPVTEEDVPRRARRTVPAAVGGAAVERPGDVQPAAVLPP
ncbi:hypothetical protein ACFRKE_09375, partial [Kitasatospora indigofera]|uniref:hypothetical protein n=1 Tax=Kitasatospora indigofera TaxID=67307 RepID=UPI0036C3D0B9